MTPWLDPGRVDVLVPHYNDSEGLARSVESIKCQDWKYGFRLVVVDDGSERRELRQAHAYLQESQIPYVLESNERNRGRPHTRSRLLTLIDSPYVTWLDSGDSWYREKTTLQFERLRALSLEGQATDHIWITCDYDWQWLGRPPEALEQRTDGDQLRLLMEGRELRAYLWTLFSTREATIQLGPFDEKLPRLQDLDFFLRFAEMGGRLETPQSKATRPLCIYRKSDVGRDARQVFACNRYIIEKHGAHYSAYGSEFYEQRLIQARVLAGRFAWNNRDYLLATRFWGEAVIRHPSFAGRFLARKVKERLQK
jgi:glycosyltransferase involved in cell wall biosynthesis